MVKLLSCSQGHYWESAETSDGASVQQVFCPVCGGIADVLPLLDLAPSEPTIARPGVGAIQPLPLRDPAGRPVVAGYEILEDLGRGPTGMLGYRARQQGVGRTVLLHVAVAREDPGQQIWGTLRSESSALGKLAHPNLIHILEAGERDRQLFYNVLEWIEGPSLALKMAQGPLPLKQIVSLMEMLARAVHFAHERGVVHRNLKPASILLQDCSSEPGEPASKKNSTSVPGKRSESSAGFLLHPSALFPRVVDWGLTRRPQEGDTCDLDLHCWAGEGRKPGLPFYLSPEQVWGRVKDIGPACDIYSLGAILFELLAGQPPHKAGQLSEVLDKIQTEETPLPEVVAEGKYRALARSAEDLELICKKCLRKDPKRRYASALDLAEDLQRYSRGQLVKARSGGSKAHRAGLWVRRRGGVLLVALLILGVLVGIPIAYNAGKSRSQGFPGAGQSEAWFQGENRRLRQDLQQAQQTVQTAQYARRLSLIQRDIDLDQPMRALEQLNSLATERHWEWYYLHASARQTAKRKLLTCESPVRALALSPNGQYLAVAGSDPEEVIFPNQAKREVRLWDFFAGREQIGMPKFNGPVRSLCFNPSSDTLAVIVHNNFQGSELVSWHTQIRRELWQRQLGGQTCAVLWMPDGQKLLTLDRDGTLHEQQAGGGVPPVTRQTSPAEPWRNPTGDLPMALSNGPGGMRLAVLATDGQTIHVLDPWRNYSLIDLRGHTDRVTGLAGNPTTNQLASVSRDGTLRIWDAATGKEAHVLRGHAGPIHAVVFSADGRRVITCGQDNTIRVWDPQGGIEMLTLKMAENNLSVLALSVDGRQLALGHGNDVTVLGPPR